MSNKRKQKYPDGIIKQDESKDISEQNGNAAENEKEYSLIEAVTGVNASNDGVAWEKWPIIPAECRDYVAIFHVVTITDGFGELV